MVTSSWPSGRHRRGGILRDFARVAFASAKVQKVLVRSCDTVSARRLIASHRMEPWRLPIKSTWTRVRRRPASQIASALALLSPACPEVWWLKAELARRAGDEELAIEMEARAAVIGRPGSEQPAYRGERACA